MKNKISICVTAIGSGSFGEQVLKALHKSTLSYDILGLDAQRPSAGVGLCDSFELVPLAKDEKYIPEIINFCSRYKIKVLIPGSEAELIVLSSHRHIFEQMNIFLPICNDSLLTLCLNKEHLHDVLYQKGIHVPWSALITNTNDLSKNLPFPLIFKPNVGGGGSVDVFIVQNKTEAEFFGKYLLESRGKFIAQEYVGSADDEYTVGVLTDMHGELIQSVALKRNINSALSRKLCVPNKTQRTDLGQFLVVSSGLSQGAIGQWSEICKPCEDIAKTLGARGPFNLQGRLVDGKFILFEINPRFSGTSHMRALVGMNEADLLIRHHVLGEDIPRNQRLESKTILRRLEEVVV